MAKISSSKSLTIRLLILVLAGASCGEGTKVLAPALPPPVSNDHLRAAPDTLSLVGFGSVIAADVYRDFTPNSPSGHPLTAVITFSLISASDFSGNVAATYVYVLNGNEVWKSALQMQDPSTLPHDEVILTARDGPEWSAGTQVDVVLGLEIRGRGFQLVNLGNVAIAQLE
jgi:hypothetical protein